MNPCKSEGTEVSFTTEERRERKDTRQDRAQRGL